MSKRKLKIDSLMVRGEAMPQTVNEETRTAEFVFTTGAAVLRTDYWTGKQWKEVLEVSEKAVRLDFFNSGAPFLLDHNAYSVRNQVGVIEKAWLADGKGYAQVRFAKDEASEVIFQKVKDGILRNVSVGYKIDPESLVDDSQKGDEIKTYRAISWEPLELSLVTIPADRQAQVRSEEQARTEIEIIERSFEEQETTVIETPIERNQDMPPEITAEQKEAQQKAVQAERARAKEIRSAVKIAGLEGEVAEDMIERGIELDAARAEIFEKMEARNAKVTPQVNVSVTVDETEKTRVAIVDALLHRSSPSIHKLEGHAVEFRGMSLLDVAKECLQARGVRARGMTKSEIALRALTTSDLPNILSNVASKKLQMGYNVLKPTFWPFVKQGVLPDFKEVSRVQLGDVANLEEMNEDGEYTYTTLTDSGEKYKVAKHGKIIRITEEVIVNDDMNALARMPELMGNAAARLESKLVYTDILMGNPAMADGTALFHADRANRAASGGAITETTLSAGEKAIMDQKPLGSNDFLGLVPQFLVVGTAKKTEGKKLMSAIFASKSSDVNPFNGEYQLIVDPRVTGNAWFLIANPAMIDTIELGYLEGEMGPVMSSQTDFKNDGLELKVRHVVGAKAIDFRGMYYNPGA